MSGKPDYTKVNATRQSTHVLNILAAERAKPVYVVLDEILRENFKEYFRKIGYWKNKADKTGENKKANRKALRENQKIGLSRDWRPHTFNPRKNDIKTNNHQLLVCHQTI